MTEKSTDRKGSRDGAQLFSSTPAALLLRSLSEQAAEAELRLRIPQLTERVAKLDEVQIVPQELWERVVSL